MVMHLIVVPATCNILKQGMKCTNTEYVVPAGFK